MRSFEERLKTRPLIIREMAKKYPPNKFYKIRNKGHIYTLYSYSEDKTVSVDISNQDIKNINPVILYNITDYLQKGNKL